MKAITFDFWNTLFDSSGGELRNAYRLRAVIEEMDKHGILIKQDEFTKAMYSSWDFFNKIWKTEQRTPHPKETVEFFWDYLKLPASEDSIDEIIEKFADSILVHPPKLIDGISGLIENLATKYTLGIVSDTGFSPGSILKKLLEKEGLLHYFKAFSFSDETGVSKPHPKAFMKVLDELECSPSEALHIGDIEDTDIKGAKNLGMKAVRFSGDPTAKLSMENPTTSIADYEIFSWNEFPAILESFENE